MKSEDIRRNRAKVLDFVFVFGLERHVDGYDWL